MLVRVGRADAAIKLRIGRLLIVFSPFGAGGFCRTRGRVTRQQALMRVLAGPAVNFALALLLWLAGQAASDAAHPVLFTLAALNGLALLNLIPHRTQWNPITKGLPSDGLQALCLLRDRPLPPPRPPGPAVGMRTPSAAIKSQRPSRACLYGFSSPRITSTKPRCAFGYLSSSKERSADQDHQ